MNIFYFNELRLKGITKDYIVQFNPGLNIIVGPISTGKTTILELIDYCLGKRNHPQYKELYKASVVLLEVNISNEIITIERKLFSLSSDIKIHLSSIKNLDKEHQNFNVAPYQVKNRESISSFILKKLNLWNIPLKEAPSRDETGVDIMSLRDLLWFCYLDQGRIDDDKDFLFEKTFMKKIKLRQVFKVIFEIYDHLEATLKYQYKTYNEIFKEKNKSLNSIKEFLEKSRIPERDELIKEKKGLEKELYLAKKEYDKLTNEILEKTNFSKSFREELKILEKKISENEYLLRENRILKEKMLTLLGQYEEDIRRISALIEAREIINPLSIKRCPICLNELILEVKDEKCPLCEQEFFVFKIEDDEYIEPTTELSRLKNKYNELTDVIDNLDSEIINLEIDIKEKNAEFNRKSIDLENRIESFISPLTSLREQKYSKIQEIKIITDEINEKIQYFAPLEPLERELVELRSNIEKVKNKLETLTKKAKSYQNILEKFSQYFYSILKRFNFPKLDKDTFINDQLTPYVRNTNYHFIGSAGATVLITQAWIIAFFHLFINFESNHPKFFLIDSPQTNIGLGRDIEEQYRDENIVKGIYREYKKLIDQSILEQIIIVDWIPPQGYKDYYCIEYTGDPNKKPYGLIDDEVK